MKNETVKLPDVKHRYAMVREPLNLGYGDGNASIELLVDAAVNCIIEARHPLANTRRVSSDFGVLYCVDDVMGYVAKNIEREMDCLRNGTSERQILRLYQGY